MKRPLTPPDWDELRNIPLGLEIEEIEPGDSPHEARMRSETARGKFDRLEQKPEWFQRYDELRSSGWSWRVAVYIAWASSPRKTRWPRSQEELATEVLGLTSDRQIWTWRQKNQAIDETVAILQAAPLFEHRADIFRALIESASSPDYKSHQDRKIALEMLGDYVPRLRVDDARRGADDLSELSDDELARLARVKPTMKETSPPAPPLRGEGSETEEGEGDQSSQPDPDLTSHPTLSLRGEGSEFEEGGDG